MRKISIKQKIALIFLGLFLCGFLLEIGLRIGGLVYLSLQEQQNKTSIKRRGTYRIMCLGESTTAMGGKYSYPSQLEDILNQRNIGIKFSVINKGNPGGRIGAIVAQLEDNLKKYNPDMVITMLGINDENDVLRAGADNKAHEHVCPSENTNFINSLRTCTLAKLIWQRIANRSGDRGILKLEEKFTAVRENNLIAQIDFGKQEGALGEEININSGGYESYVKLGRYYRNRGEYEKAEKMLEKAIEIKPKSSEVYVEYSWLYRELGKYDKTKMMLERAIELNPESDKALFAFGSLYLSFDEWEEAESFLKRAVEVNPQNVDASVLLGVSYEELGKGDQAEEIFRRTIDIEPGNTMAYTQLGGLYTARREYGKAEEWLQKAIDANPKNYTGYVELGQWYMNRKEYEKAEAVLLKAIGVHPRINILYGMLYQVYREKGESESAEEFFRKTKTSGLEGYSPIVSYHYRRLKEIVTGRGIKLVCVQYPVCSVAPLKRMLGENALIYFVDNEKVFKNALKKAKNEEYFTDNFGGEFGHCTPKGNRLLAENIADVIFGIVLLNE